MFIISCQWASNDVTVYQLLTNYGHFIRVLLTTDTLSHHCRLTVCVIKKKHVKKSCVCLRTCMCMWRILSGQNEGWQMEYMDQATILRFRNSLCPKEIRKTIELLTPFILPDLHSYFNILGTPVHKVNCNLWAWLLSGNEWSWNTSVTCFNIKSVFPFA